MHVPLENILILAIAHSVLTVELPGVQQVTENIVITTEVPRKENATTTEVPIKENATTTEVPIKENGTTTEVPIKENATTTEVPRKQNVTLSVPAEYFKLSELVTDLIPVAPDNLVHVTFPSGVNVSLGNKLTPTQVKDMPSVSWNANSTEYYTLIYVDPDQPSRYKPFFRSTLQWCVVNIPGNDVSSGETLAEYISAGPSEKSGLHRLTFLVYQQPGIVRFNETRLSAITAYGRHQFNVTNFAMKYNLSNPIAGNFFQTTFDRYVPVLYKRLGISHSNVNTPSNTVIAVIILAFFSSNIIFISV